MVSPSRQNNGVWVKFLCDRYITIPIVKKGNIFSSNPFFGELLTFIFYNNLSLSILLLLLLLLLLVSFDVFEKSKS